MSDFDKALVLEVLSQIDWKRAKGLRDIISHQYFDLNAEAIYDVCERQIETLAQTIEKIVKDLS